MKGWFEIKAHLEDRFKFKNGNQRKNLVKLFEKKKTNLNELYKS